MKSLLEWLRPYGSRLSGLVPSGSTATKPFGRGSIRTRLVIIFIALTLIPVAITAAVATLIGQNTARSRLEDTLNAVMELQDTRLQNWSHTLTEGLDAELENANSASRLHLLLLFTPNTSLYNRMADAQFQTFSESIERDKIFDEIFLLDKDGNVLLSTNKRQEGENFANQEFFQQGLQGKYLQPPTYEPSLDRISVIVSTPIETQIGEVSGVLAGRANMQNLEAILQERRGLGETGEIYLVGADGMLLTPVSSTEYLPVETYVRSEGALQATQGKLSGVGLYTNYQGIPVSGAYHWQPDLQSAVLVEEHQNEAFRPVYQTSAIIIGVALASAILAIFAALLVSGNVSRPLVDLAQTAEKIASGDLELRVDTQRSDEIGSLAIAFNTMTAQLRNLIGSLETRVTERTRQLQSRTEQLLAAAEVGRYATTLLDSGQLMQRTVDLIQQRFNLYYVGLFLVDEAGEWAELKAGSGYAGQAMLARGHRLRVFSDDLTATLGEAVAGKTQTSMIGWCIAQNQARIALEAGEDPIRLATPELPETRSEAAIPLRSRGKVIGALTVQSANASAFDREAITVFQTVADQVAVALDNARLFQEAQGALETIHQSYGELSRQAWLQRLSRQPLAWRRNVAGMHPIEAQNAISSSVADRLAATEPAGNLSDESLDTERDALGENEDGRQEAVRLPLLSRGNVIGYIYAAKGQPYKEDEVNLLGTLTEQLGVALDSARLFEQTQLQAERERLIGEITGRMRASLDIQTILETATREMRDVLGLAEVEIRLGVQSPQGSAAPPSTQPDSDSETSLA